MKDKLIKVNKDIDKVMKNILPLPGVKNIACFNCEKAWCCVNCTGPSISDKELSVIKALITPEQRKRGLASINQKALTGRYDCPFLSSEGRCEIYESRPVACSTYFVVNGTEDNCKHGDRGVYYIQGTDIIKQIPKESISVIREVREVFDLLEVFK